MLVYSSLPSGQSEWSIWWCWDINFYYNTKQSILFTKPYATPMLSRISGENRLNIILAALANIACQMCESVGRIRKNNRGGVGAEKRVRIALSCVSSLFPQAQKKRGWGKNQKYRYAAGSPCGSSRRWRVIWEKWRKRTDGSSCQERHCGPTAWSGLICLWKPENTP